MNTDIQELYQQVILEHNKNPKHFYEMTDATHFAHGYNPLCGDTYKVFLKMDDAGVIRDASFSGHGCAISKASASLMSDTLIGKTAEQAEQLYHEFHQLVTGENPNFKILGKLKIFAGVKQFPARVKCASLCWHATKAALDQVSQISTE